jgi:cyclase
MGHSWINVKRWGGAVFVLAAPMAALAQHDFAGATVKTIKVTDRIYMLEGRGGNIGVSAGPDGVLIVDDQFAPLADKIKAALKYLGSDKPKYILNTHWHGDHVGGNPAFGKDGTIIAHTNVRKRVTTRQMLFGKEVEALSPDGWPVITFDESVSIHFNGEEIRVMHYPGGHTDGDIIVFFTGSNVVHMGDHLFTGMFPFVDLDHGGDVEGMTRNIERVLKEIPADAKIIPGHGPLSTAEDLKAFHSMLVETTNLVRNKIAAGLTLDQIKSEGVPDRWQKWGEGFINTDQWLETVHRSLTR